MSRVPYVLLTVVLTAAVAAPASAAPKRNTETPQEVSAYWTPERMKNAKPRARVKPGGSAAAGGTTSDWSRYAVALGANGAYANADRQNGKVFMTIGGGNYVCSGTAVTASAGVNLVWTAGHCVTDGPGQEASKFMFVPGYYRGAEPNGRWVFTVLDSTAGWEAQGADRFRYDAGAARVVNSANAGATFESTIGTRPISFGVNPTGQRLVAIGYPASGKFNGSQQYACASPFRRWDGTAQLDPMQISCDMTGGSSGGGWFLDVDRDSLADSGEPLVSNTSYGYQSLKNALFGPFLSSPGQAQTLYNSLD